jgi:hypothetical protein
LPGCVTIGTAVPATRSRSFVSHNSVQLTPQSHGNVLATISDGMVALLTEFYGHGQTGTKSYLPARVLHTATSATTPANSLGGFHGQ